MVGLVFEKLGNLFNFSGRPMDSSEPALLLWLMENFRYAGIASW